MSSSIDHVMTPVFDAYMDARDIVELREKYEDNLPEVNFIGFHYKEALKLLAARATCSACCVNNEVDAKFCKGCGAAVGHEQQSLHVKLRKFSWCYMGSADSYDILVKDIAPKVKGVVEAIFQWEGGDLDGLAIKDGKVARCKVEPRLVKPEGW